VGFIAIVGARLITGPALLKVFIYFWQSLPRRASALLSDFYYPEGKVIEVHQLGAVE
jgi:hypothetical protein